MRTIREPCSDYLEALTILALLRAAFPARKVEILTPGTFGRWGVALTVEA